jgi:AcrR family transcriptional regulator
MNRSRRDDLIETALHLFKRHGYHATGIERILTTAGASKPTLYRHFDSKDELIVAALERWDGDSRAWLAEEMAKAGGDPRAQILELFRALADWFEDVGFQGCLFINATVEFADRANPVHRTAAAHKRRFAAFVREKVVATGAVDPDETTARLMLLMEGAIITAHTQGRSEAALRAQNMARDVLDAAIARAAA